MNKGLLVIALLMVAVIALSTTSVVHAQTETPTNSTTDFTYGFGHRGGGGMMGGSGSGILHDEMVAIFAEKLGLTVEEIESRLTTGETMSDIALAQGYTYDEFVTMMTEVRTQSINQAVSNGTLTQEQADWMNSRVERMGTGLYGMQNSEYRGMMGNGTCPRWNP